MAGPAIRAAELARALAARHRVTLAAPAPSSAPPGVELLEAGFEDFDALVEAARRARRACWRRSCRPTLLGRLSRLPVRIALDLYNPIVMEVLEAVADERPRVQRRIQELVGMRALAQCAVADFIVCASERQRDLWLGAMAVHGLIDLDAYRRDPTLRSLIDVVAVRHSGRAAAGALRRAGAEGRVAGDRAPTTACSSGRAASGAGSTPPRRSGR